MWPYLPYRIWPIEVVARKNKNWTILDKNSHYLAIFNMTDNCCFPYGFFNSQKCKHRFADLARRKRLAYISLWDRADRQNRQIIIWHCLDVGRMNLRWQYVHSHRIRIILACVEIGNAHPDFPSGKVDILINGGLNVRSVLLRPLWAHRIMIDDIFTEFE